MNTFLKEYICLNCTDKNKNKLKEEKDANNENALSIKYHTSRKCKEIICKNDDKMFSGKNAFDNWSKHYMVWQPNTDYLEITNQNIVMNNIKEINVKHIKLYMIILNN